jgi:hypothetical protein
MWLSLPLDDLLSSRAKVAMLRVLCRTNAPLRGREIARRSDAVCLHLGEGKPEGRSHTEAATMLQDVCRGTAWEDDAAKRSRQLVDILRLKTAVQYGSRVLRADELKRLMGQARRFIEWAETILPPSAK